MTIADDEAPAASPAVELRVPAEPSYLHLLRVVVSSLAGQHDFDVESLSELRMAVDEACATLITVAAVPAVLGCWIREHDSEIEFEAKVLSMPGSAISQRSLGWRMLTTLADQVDLLDGGHAEPMWVGIRLRKRADADDR